MRLEIAGLSAADVAEAIDRSESLVWMVESGHKRPAPETLAAWCAVLGISIDSVFPGNDARYERKPDAARRPGATSLPNLRRRGCLCTSKTKPTLHASPRPSCHS